MLAFFLSIYYNAICKFPWGYGSVGRAMRSQRIGHEFESRYLHHMQIIRTLKTNRSSYYFFTKDFFGVKIPR